MYVCPSGSLEQYPFNGRASVFEGQRIGETEAKTMVYTFPTAAAKLEERNARTRIDTWIEVPRGREYQRMKQVLKLISFR